ncbi:hypothetical protein NDU88_007032 [Pleurodeles waltl]|uniref:Uncharacterized protein n=1 Tax=Pleurodeles waltl TaxID=8319 RepID=A0AAV7PN50_PLEWA|nr:hypothetical protein NDU88_007032 [Pleurodeles waltl]
MVGAWLGRPTRWPILCEAPRVRSINPAIIQARGRLPSNQEGEEAANPPGVNRGEIAGVLVLVWHQRTLRGSSSAGLVEVLVELGSWAVLAADLRHEGMGGPAGLDPGRTMAW